ncbi:MAG: hypothetical protein LBM00_00805 [Deltaproteobacteria bacterium]|nr:hypothetical protein [Deltaproteobacteria bacterium]
MYWFWYIQSACCFVPGREMLAGGRKLAVKLRQFNFETLSPALYGETSFAYAYGAGGDTRRQSVSTFSMLKRSSTMSHLKLRFATFEV